MAKRIPQRMCVACRKMGEKRQLIRLVLGKDGSVALDPVGKMPGRGAYVCRQKTCLEQALRGRKLDKGLRVSVPEPVIAALAAELAGLPAEQAEAEGRPMLQNKPATTATTIEQVLRMIGLAQRAGRVSAGFDAAAATIAQGGANLVIVARDAAERTANRIQTVAGQAGTAVRFAAKRADLGHWTGAADRAVLAIRDPEFAARLIELIDNMAPTDKYKGQSADHGEG